MRFYCETSLWAFYYHDLSTSCSNTNIKIWNFIWIFCGSYLILPTRQIWNMCKISYLPCWQDQCNSHLRHRLKIFLFRRKIMFRSQDLQVFVFLIIPWDTKSVTSRWLLVYKTSYVFEYIFWTTTHEVTKLAQLIDISKGNNFQ